MKLEGGVKWDAGGDESSLPGPINIYVDTIQKYIHKLKIRTPYNLILTIGWSLGVVF